MKRIIVGILIMALFFQVSVYAEDFDLSSMEIDQLLKLRDEITVELNNKGYDELGIINEGVYAVGVDIKEGTYTFTSVDEDWAGIYIFESKENYDEANGNRGYADKYAELDKYDTSTVSLLAGMYVMVKGQGVLEATEKPSWAP